MNDDTFGCIFYAAILAIFVVGSLIFSPMSCAAKFPTMETSWGPIQGCLVNTSQGWIPAENYRVM